MPVCPAEGCRQAITENQPTIRLSAGTLQRGKKTGGYYHSKTFETDILIHYGCALLYFNPNADKDMYDEFRSRVEEDVKTEMLDDLRQEAFADAAEDIKNLCADCRDHRIHPDRPPCEDVECPHCGATSAPICGNCGEIREIYPESDYVEPEKPPAPTLPQPSRQPTSPYFNTR